jgi:hypothetical protein
MSELYNKERSEKIRNILESSGYVVEDSITDAVTDLLADLHHFCYDLDINLEDRVEGAAMHFEAEIAEASRRDEEKQRLIESGPGLLAACKEFVADCEAVGKETMAADWPDLFCTYQNAVKAIESTQAETYV